MRRCPHCLSPYCGNVMGRACWIRLAKLRPPPLPNDVSPVIPMTPDSGNVIPMTNEDDRVIPMTVQRIVWPRS